MFEIWWAYYQCEPFGNQWEQTATLASLIHSSSCMTAATRGAKLDPIGVADFFPSDSIPWHKRTKLKRKGIRHPGIQAQIMKQAFGFK